MQIDGNEELLNKFEHEINRKGLTFRSADAFGKSLEEFANRERQRSGGNVSVQIRRADDGVAMVAQGALDQGLHPNAEGDNGRGTEDSSNIIVTIKTGYSGDNNPRYMNLTLSELRELQKDDPYELRTLDTPQRATSRE